MKFTKRKSGYVPAAESLNETLSYTDLGKEDVTRLVNGFPSKSEAKQQAESIQRKYNRGDGSIVKREIVVTVQIKDVK